MQIFIPVPHGVFPSQASPESERRQGKTEHAPMGATMYKTLTDEQKVIVDEVLESVRLGLGKGFFLSGQGGSGKTYLYMCL